MLEWKNLDEKKNLERKQGDKNINLKEGKIECKKYVRKIRKMIEREI